MSRRTRSSPRKEGDSGEMAPHLAREDELPFVGQGTSLGTTTDSPPPTTTTTPNSAAEFDSNFAVGDADQDYYASTSNVAPNNWNIEGVASLDDKGVRHMNAFYAVLKEWIGKKEYTTKLMMKAEGGIRQDCEFVSSWSKRGDHRLLQREEVRECQRL